MSMVLALDGPERGKLRMLADSSSNCYMVSQFAPVTAPIDYGQEVMLKPLTYHIHKILFLGFIIRVASLKLLPDDIDPYDVIELLLTDAARQATERPS